MKEKQFEEHIEAALLSPEGGYTKGEDSYDEKNALYTGTLLSFIEETQAKEWRKFTRCVSHDPEGHFLRIFNERCAKEGLLSVLRQGIRSNGVTLKVCYFKPESGLNAEHREKYAANRVEVYRQWRYSATCGNSVDMVLAVNGIPVIAFELKNQLTGQSVENAKKQWRQDRDPKETCFRFNYRILAYFCIDLFEVYMSTRLAGEKTYFLPFNQGSEGAGQNGGKGNPPAAEGEFAVSYMWKEVFQRDSMLDILHRFINLEGVDGKRGDINKGRLIFPRYHQLDVVRKLVNHVREHGSGHHYLIQHSAGSGKSNSIAWVAHRLASLHDREDKPIFSSIIVVTDRTVLDAQLRSTIQGHDHTLGTIVAIDDSMTSRHLKDAINDGKRIIITTLQKFPVIYQEVEHVAGRKFGVIIDEAHSSQGGSAAASMKSALADTQAALEKYAEEEEIAAEELDAENRLVREMMTHGRHENLSFFAFTATPKDTTLEQFCTKGEDGRYHPFHIYSMRQAIEEGFILDVLKNYTTYSTCYKLVREAAENEELPSSKASRLIRRYAMLHPENIRQKAEIIVETFRDVTRHKIKGNGKMMVVSSSRLAAVLLFRAIKKYAQEEGYADVKPMVAFSGTVMDGDEELSESKLNVRPDGSHISEAQTKEEFHRHFNILIVAEKYQTGFDESLLHTMIVDKKLRNVKCVQTLSRLNRTAAGKEDTFVLDFVNTQEDIKTEFQPFYQETLLEGELNIDLLYQTVQEIEKFHVYDEGDVRKVVSAYTQHGDEVANTAAILTGLLTPIIRTYQDLQEDDQYTFRRKLRCLVRWYAHIAQIIRLNDECLHGEYIFARYLIKLLPQAPGEIVDIEDKIRMEYYKLKETAQGSIQLDKKDGVLTPGEETGAAGPPDKKDPLDELLARINKKVEADFTENDIVLRPITQKLMEDKKLAASARTSDPNVFREIFRDGFRRVVMECYQESMERFDSLMMNDEKREMICSELSGELYRMYRSTYSEIEESDMEAAEGS